MVTTETANRTGVVQRGESTARSEQLAVSELVEQIWQPDLAGVLFFCSADYDLEQISSELQKSFNCPVIGTTTAGEIGSSYQKGGIVGVSFASSHFALHPRLIDNLEGFSAAVADEMAKEVESELVFADRFSKNSAVGFLLIDGLAMKEEQTVAYLSRAFSGLELVGGSAGDSLKFQKTQVYMDGQFYTAAAVYMLIETKLAIETFKLQHFEPSDREVVVTESDPCIREISELDGGRAAEEYANALGFQEDELSPAVFSSHPFMLQVGNEWYVRAIRGVGEEGSLQFYCAIDNGLPLNIANSVSLVDSLGRQVDKLEQQFTNIHLTLGCDCILRRLEIEEKDLSDQVEPFLDRIRFTGFSTFGEQIGAIHVSQTLTGVVFGEK